LFFLNRKSRHIVDTVQGFATALPPAILNSCS
jgi:hypothetical protein